MLLFRLLFKWDLQNMSIYCILANQTLPCHSSRSIIISPKSNTLQLQKFLTQTGHLSPNRATHFLQNDKELSTTKKSKVTFHANIPMSFYKPWSKILHKAAKGWRRSKMKSKWRIVTFPLSHCTVCPFALFPPLFSQLLHQLLTWLKKMKKSLKFCWFWLKTSG